MRWMRPPELGREPDRERFDPIVEGARHRLSRELSLAIWQQVRTDATDSAGRCDVEQARRRFHEIAARVAARGGRLRPDVGRTTRVAAGSTESAESYVDSLGTWPTDLRLHAPGRETLVGAELRRWIGNGYASADPEVTDPTAPRRELPGAGEVARAMAALQRQPDPVRPAKPAMHTHVGRPSEIGLRAWSRRGPAAEASPEPDWLARADRAMQVREAARLHRAGELAEALRRGRPGLADAVAAALHDGAILAPHPVEVLRDSVRGLGAELTAASHGFSRAAARFLGTTPLAPVGRRAFAVADAWTGGAARAWTDRARGWADGVARRAMAFRDGVAARGAEDELAKLPASGGAPLPPALRARMEALFGHRFAHVRVHTDGDVAQAAEAAGARAVTMGSHIYFGRGQFAPGSEAGDRLLLHELTHVVQHDQGRLPEPAGGWVELSSPSDPAEQEARAMESRVGEARAMGAPAGELRRGEAGEAHTAASPANAARTAVADHAAGPTAAPSAPARNTATGDVPRTGKRASANIFGDAANWVGDRIDDVENWAEDKIEGLVARVAPGLITLIHEGPGGLIKDAIQPAISSWVGSITGGVNLGQIAGQLKGSFSAAFAVLQGAKAGDAKCCDTLVSGINAIREVAHAFMNNPVMDAIKGIFTKVSDIIGTVTKLVIGPAVEVLKTIVGGAWDAIKGVASTIQGWFDTVKNIAGKAFDWVAQKLGFSGGTGEGGLLDWLKQKAAEIWDKIKQTLQPVIGPLKVVAGVLLMFTGLPEIYAIIKYGPQLVEAVQWLWANRNNPEAVKKNPGLLGGSILPKILGVGQSFVAMVKSGVSWLVDKTAAFATGALQLLGAITGIPLLGMARGFVQTLVDGIQGVQAWAAGAFTSAETWLDGLFHRIADFIKPYAEVLCSVAMAITNPAMIPVILAGWAWRWLPDCIKPPLIDLLLDAVLAVLEGLPSLPMLGPLWPLLKSGVLGFLHALRARDPETKIKVSNKLAKIISGASPMFLLGFVKGFLRGVWDGIKMPFEAIWLVIQGLHKAVEFFDSLGNEADGKAQKPAAAATQTTAAPHPAGTSTGTPPVSPPSVIQPDQIQGVVSGIATQLSEHKPPRPATSPAPAANGSGAHANQYQQLGQEAHRMGGELAGPAATVTSNFWPAVQELFSSKGGGSIDDLIAKLGKVWEAAKAAIASLGGKIANMICDFFMKDSAEEELGDTVGYMVGMIAFQALLEYLSAGTWDGVMAVLQAIAKFLNWPMEFLGEAMGLLKELGGFLLDGIKELGSMAVEGASSALGEVMGALGDIGTKLEEFADELLGKFGSEAEAEAGAAESQAAHAAENDAADAAAAEEEGELSAAEREAEKAEELVEAEAVIQGIKRAAEAGHVPGPALVAALDGLKERYSWVEGFGPVGEPAPFELIMYASEHDEGLYNPGGVPKPGEPQPVEPQPVEPQPVEPQPVEPQPVEPQPTEPKPEGEPKPEMTDPSGKPDLSQAPGGKPTTIDPTDAPENIQALTRENESAKTLAENGYSVEQNPAVPGPKNPDYKIEGKIFDNYAPTTSSPRNIWSTVQGKVEADQASRIVLNLDDSAVKMAALEKQFADWPIEGLEEVLVVKNGTVVRFWPR